MSCGGNSLEEATLSAENHIDKSFSSEYDNVMNIDSFRQTMNDPKILGSISSVLKEEVTNSSQEEGLNVKQ